MYKRTVREFVREKCQEGLTDLEILAVARCTRWVAHLEEVKGLLARGRKHWCSEVPGKKNQQG